MDKDDMVYVRAIPLLSIYREKTIIKKKKKTCLLVFTAAQSTVAETLKQPRCPLAEEWIKKLWYIYMMGYYLAIKRNEFESVELRWINLLFRVN